MDALINFLAINGVSYSVFDHYFVSFTYRSVGYRLDFRVKKLYLFFYGNRLEVEFTDIETKIDECNNYITVYFNDENNLYISFEGDK